MSDTRKKLLSNVIKFDDTDEDNRNYDEINASIPTKSSISPLVSRSMSSLLLFRKRFAALRYHNDDE